MYIGIQDNKVRFYVEEVKNREFYPDVIWQETQDEYVFNEDMTEYIRKPEKYEEILAQKERDRISMLSLTKREVFLALYKAKGITPDMVKAQISDPEALIEFEYANEYFRGNPLIDLIGEKLGYSSEKLDYLFQNKELPAEALDAEADSAEDLTPSAVTKKDIEKE